MSDKPDAMVNAKDVTFAHNLKLQDMLELLAYLEMMANAPIQEIADAATEFKGKLVMASSACMKEFVAKNYPDASCAVLMPDDKTDAAKTILDEIIKKGSK